MAKFWNQKYPMPATIMVDEAWLDREVEAAVTEYLVNGRVWISDGKICFHIPSPLEITIRTSLADALTKEIDGLCHPDDLLPMREILKDALDLVEGALNG